MSFDIENIEPMSLSFPFEIEKLVDIYPGSVIVLAGEQNVGKTAFFLDFVKKNMEKYPIHYFNREMGNVEFNLRLRLHKDIDIKNWKFKAYERSTDFEDVVVPNEINIIDYIELGDKFWLIGDKLAKIHDKLKSGIALVGIQKEFYKDLGRGGGFGLDIPRLYMTMGKGVLKIIKAKNWANISNNPNGKFIQFKLVSGWKFIPSPAGWKDEESLEDLNESKGRFRSKGKVS